MKGSMSALVAQLRSPNEDLCQGAASVLRNLSWRADLASKKTLREVSFFNCVFYFFEVVGSAMSAYTEIICPCTTRQAQYQKYSPDALTPPSFSYSPSLSLGTGIEALIAISVEDRFE
jgi:hypothetical protein